VKYSLDDFALAKITLSLLVLSQVLKCENDPGTTMIYEHRTYRVSAGKAAEFLRLYEGDGLHIITRYAKLAGCWTTESGTLNSIIFLWAYNDLGHRTEQRAKLGADTEWQAFVPKILPYLEYQESFFLTPAPFSPLE
jgi:hypothetical protein